MPKKDTETQEVLLTGSDCAIIIRDNGEVRLIHPDVPPEEASPALTVAAWVAALIRVGDKDLEELLLRKARELHLTEGDDKEEVPQ